MRSCTYEYDKDYAGDCELSSDPCELSNRNLFAYSCQLTNRVFTCISGGVSLTLSSDVQRHLYIGMRIDSGSNITITFADLFVKIRTLWLVGVASVSPFACPCCCAGWR